MRAGRIWAFFAMCGLFGALGTAAFSVGAAKDTPPAQAASSTPAANPIQAEMAVRRAAEAPTSLLERSLSFFGLFALLGLCWL
ncbi:MAG: hypothetical protein AAB578_03050, partial [Elusimicrobiota bacterium]